MFSQLVQQIKEAITPKDYAEYDLAQQRERARRRLSHNLKYQKTIEFLGEEWVMHPNYKPNPRHANLEHVWWPNRSCKGVC